MAVLAVAAVAAFRVAAWPILGADIPWIPFALSVIVAAQYGGFWPGVAATLFSALATDYLLLEPFGSFAISTPSHVTGVVVFGICGLLISWLVERMRAAQRRAEELAESLHAGNTHLQAQAEELAAAIEELQMQTEELQAQSEELVRTGEEAKRAAEALREADERKDEFLAMLAHELRNPLAAIVSAVQIMGLRGLGDPALERARGAAERQSAHMARLLDDLLDVARITQGKIALRRERVDLGAVLESAVEATTSLIRAREHRLRRALPEEVLPLDADPTRLAQVFANLLNNAAKYTPPGGEIDLSAERVGDCAVVRVRDDGAGISPELLPRVFDLFVQDERSPDRAQGGLGVGLTMVRRLVEMHGGSVEAHSDGPGKGSEFTVWLPLAEGQPAAPSPGAAPAQSGFARRVLLVDDNADAAELLAMLLEAEGHQVVVAHSGPEALELAGGYRPDVVLLDIGMPGMDGYEVARRLRATPDFAGTPIVAVTGYGQEDDLERARNAGFDHHLLKPVGDAALRRVLRLGRPDAG